MRNIWGFAFILAMMLAPIRSEAATTATARAKEPTLKEIAAKLTPPAGFKASGGAQFFDQENLYKAINGMAPEYVSYGATDLAMLEWPPRKDSEEKIQVEIYDMGSPLGAFGIYSRAHTGGDEGFADIGEEAAVAEDMIEFARGRFYARVMGPLDSQALLEGIGKSIVKLIPAGPRPDTFLKLLPAKGRVPRTERWIPDSAFGMEFMRNVEKANYQLGEKAVELYIATFPSAKAAGEAVMLFRKAQAKQAPKTLEGEMPGFVYRDEWIGNVAVFQQDRYIIVVVGYESGDSVQGLLRETRARLTRTTK